MVKTDNPAQKDSQKESDRPRTINDVPVKREETKLHKQSAMLGTLLGDVVDYNKDKMLSHGRSNNSGLCAENGDTFQEIPNDEGNKRLVATSASPERTSVSELMPDASGDAHLPNLVCVSDLQLESKLTEDFRKEMEKRRSRCNHEPKSTKWSYTEALQSLQNFMENGDTNKDSFTKSGVVEEQNTNKSTRCSRSDDERKENTEIRTDYCSLLETVNKLLNQIHTKYSTVMLDGRGYNRTPHNLENSSESKFEMTRDLCTKQGSVREDLHVSLDHVKFREKNIDVTEKNFVTNNGKPSHYHSKYNSNIEIVHKDRPEKEKMQRTLPKVEKSKIKEKKVQYPHSKWQPVEENNKIQEQNTEIVRAELLKELQECNERLEELYSGESFSSDNECHSSTETSSESTEDSSTEYAESESSVERDNDSNSELYVGNNETDFDTIGDQRHGADYSFYSQRQSTPEFVGAEQQDSYACNNMHGVHPTEVPNWFSQSHGSDWFKHWYHQHYWTSSHTYHPLVGQSYVSYLKHYRNCCEQAAKYYSDLANCYQTDNNLHDTYQLQSSYIKEMSKKE